jgi:hypothetical protein
VRLLDEIRATGYTGGYSQLKAWVRRVRPTPVPEPTLGDDRRPGAVAQLVDVPVHVSGADPAVNRVAADAQLARQGALTRALLEVVLEKHSRLSSEHRASARRRDAW